LLYTWTANKPENLGPISLATSKLQVKVKVISFSS
jgi:hypothetical protein